MSIVSLGASGSLSKISSPQGIDIKAGGRIKNGNRKAPTSENVYIRLLVKVNACKWVADSVPPATRPII